MEEGSRVPFREELIPTPPFFGKSAQAIDGKEIGVKREVYGKWKSAEGTEGKGDRGGREKKERDMADERRGASKGAGRRSCVAYHVGYYHRGIKRRSDFQRRAVEKQRKSKDQDG